MLENVGNTYRWTGWHEIWVVTSNQCFYHKTFSSVLVITAYRTVNVLVLCSVEIKSIHNFDKIWMTMQLFYKKNERVNQF